MEKAIILARDPANTDALQNAAAIRQRNARNEQWSLTPYDDNSYSHVPEFSAYDQNRFAKSLMGQFDERPVQQTAHGKIVQIEDYRPETWNDRRNYLKMMSAKIAGYQEDNKRLQRIIEMKDWKTRQGMADSNLEKLKKQEQDFREMQRQIKGDRIRTDEYEYEYNEMQGKINQGKTLSSWERFRMSQIREYLQRPPPRGMLDIEGGARDTLESIQANRRAFLALDDFQRQEVLKKGENIRQHQRRLDALEEKAEEENERFEALQDLKRRTNRMIDMIDNPHQYGWELEDEINIPEKGLQEMLEEVKEDQVNRFLDKIELDEYLKEKQEDELALGDGEGEEYVDELEV